MIIAYCEHCCRLWQVRRDRDPTLLQGACMECATDSDTEKPLAFGLLFHDDDLPDELPTGWLADDETD